MWCAKPVLSIVNSSRSRMCKWAMLCRAPPRPGVPCCAACCACCAELLGGDLRSRQGPGAGGGHAHAAHVCAFHVPLPLPSLDIGDTALHSPPHISTAFLALYPTSHIPLCLLQVGAYHLDVKIDMVVTAMIALFQTITGKIPRFRVGCY